MAKGLELSDIQGIVLSGYGHLKSSIYLFIEVVEPKAAKVWIDSMIERTTTAAPWPIGPDRTTLKPDSCLNIAFSFEGLVRLGLPVEGFSTEFREDIAGGPQSWNYPDGPANRSHRLGDIGDNDPRSWEFGGPANPRIHIMLLLYASDPHSAAALQAELLPGVERCGMNVVTTQHTYRPEVGQEPFGFMDSMSQPVIEGDPPGTGESYQGQPVIKAGEFLLGYRNEYDLFPPMPSEAEMGRNGTYLVFRKLEQDVCGFWNYIYRQARNDPDEAVWIASKFVGRWPSGAPLVLSPDKDDPDLANDPARNNKFSFARADPYGINCPVGSHVRRTNPRDSLQPTPEESLKAVRRHRLVRRGRVYGPPYPADVIGYLREIARSKNLAHFAEELDSPRGLAFIAFNSDIKRQFEFIQQTWINDPHFDGLYSTRDPLLANSYTNNGEEPENHSMVIPRRPVRREISGIPHFVRVRAGGYFFMPGIKGLKVIKDQINTRF